MEEMGMSSESHLLEISKSTHLPRQGAASNNTDNSHNTSCGNIVIVENSLHNRGAPSSVIVPFTSQSSGNIIPLSNKLKLSHKSMKTMPKITVNANNLQRLQKGKVVQSVPKKIITNDIADDDLGNILDIPIIFAKDDDNLTNIEKIPIVTPAMRVKEPQERPKLSSTTKVVLISNKQDKQAPNKPIICPNMQNLNQLILQTRSQNAGISKNRVPIENRLVQPAVKYTKIILAKRSSQPVQQNERGDQQMVATTKITENMNAPKILTFEKDENRFVQAQPSKASISYDDSLTDNVLEIEDAIKTNIIERKYVPPIDTMSPTILDVDHCDILTETKLEHEKNNSEQSTFDNSSEMQI